MRCEGRVCGLQSGQRGRVSLLRRSQRGLRPFVVFSPRRGERGRALYPAGDLMTFDDLTSVLGLEEKYAMDEKFHAA